MGSHLDDYFEHHTHDYPPERMDRFQPEILRLKSSPRSLLDIGCGTGNTMVALAQRLGVDKPVGVESASALVKTATERTGCRVIRSSVLDPAFSAAVDQKFDVVLLSSVLHHLVGNTRRTSRKNISVALKNARSVVAPGGLLVIHEPVFRPAISLGILFYTKLLISRIVKGRVHTGQTWAHLLSRS